MDYNLFCCLFFIMLMTILFKSVCGWQDYKKTILFSTRLHLFDKKYNKNIYFFQFYITIFNVNKYKNVTIYDAFLRFFD